MKNPWVAALGFAVDPLLKGPFHLFVISFPSFGRQELHEPTTILQRCAYFLGFTQQHEARHLWFTFSRRRRCCSFQVHPKSVVLSQLLVPSAPGMACMRQASLGAEAVWDGHHCSL